MQYHNEIAATYNGIVWIALIGFICYFILLFVDAAKLPPMISALTITFLMLLNLIQIVYGIQISKNIDEPLEILFYVYHFNILILSARVLKLHMQQQMQVFEGKTDALEQHTSFKRFYEKVNSLSKYSLVIFMVFLVVVAIIEIIFVFAGQGLDAPIKAFTETADWTFSKQIPPPPLEYEGHYLCTVAAGGHKKIVKPLRFGTRRGETIIVNRQLCVANAFEEWIMEKCPNFHKKIRHSYDTYGYPISRFITNPLKADVVYIIMKPLEWFFLLFLYTFDVSPEKRIQRQYTYVRSNSKIVIQN